MNINQWHLLASNGSTFEIVGADGNSMVKLSPSLHMLTASMGKFIYPNRDELQTSRYKNVFSTCRTCEQELLEMVGDWIFEKNLLKQNESEGR